MTHTCAKVSLSLCSSDRGPISVKVLLRLCRLVTGGEVFAVVRLSLVGVLEDCSESDCLLNSPVLFLSSDKDVSERVALLELVGDEPGLSRISGLVERGMKLSSKTLFECSAVAGPVRGPYPERLLAPTRFALCNSSSIP